MSIRFATFRRIRLVATMTLLEAMRQRFALLVGVLALAALAALPLLRDLNLGAVQATFVADVGFGVLALLGASLSVVATAQLFFSELEHRTVHTLLAKPVRRAEFILGKYLGAMLLVTVFWAIFSTLLIMLLPGWDGVSTDEYMTNAELVRLDLIPIAIAQWLKFAVISAFTLTIASYAQTHLFTVMTSLAVLLICHLQPLAAEIAARSDGLVAKSVAGMAATVFPNFQLFDLTSLADTGGGVAVLLARVAVYALLYAAAALGLASYCFHRREL